MTLLLSMKAVVVAAEAEVVTVVFVRHLFPRLIPLSLCTDS